MLMKYINMILQQHKKASKVFVFIREGISCKSETENIFYCKNSNLREYYDDLRNKYCY